MTTRTLVALTLATVLVAACNSGSDESEVLGVVVERSDAATEEVDVSEPSEYPGPGSRAQIREAPAVGDRGLATLAAEEPETETPAPPPREPTSEPASSEPVQPATLAEGPGNTYTWTQPEDPPQEGVWWVESSSLPAQDRDADPWNGSRVATRDAQRAEGQDTSTEPVRRATCDARLEAPADRAVTGSGTVIVELDVNGAVAASASYRFEGTIEAGGRHGFDRVGDVEVDAREGDTAACSVRFEAD